MTRRRLLAALELLAVAGLAPGAGLTSVAGAASAARHLVLISIDALRPEFYLDARHAVPTLRQLMGTGSHARAVTPVYPSATYPGHATLVTGVRPARHGILANLIWSPADGPGRWYEEAADLKAPTLWDAARVAGLTTAAVSWPSTLGARIDWLVPERDYYQRADPLPLLRAATTPGLLERLRVTARPEMFNDIVAWDAFLAATASAIVRDLRPNLLLLHLVQLDYYQHRGGTNAPELSAALARVDAHVGAVVEALRAAGIADRATVIVTGDHGFMDIRRVVLVNEILARAGLGGCQSGPTAWRATAHVSGGAAAVFLRDPADTVARAAAEAALRRGAPDRYAIVSRSRLDELGAMTAAVFAVEAAPGYALSGACGQDVEAPVARGGTHGYLPSRPEMSTGFIAAGAGVRTGGTLGRIDLVDVAPTAARLLGLTLPAVEGRVLEEILP